MNAKLILVRHGQSIYNQKNLFTGWSDVPLTPQGIEEARNVGKILKAHNLYPDICFTSWLKRAIHTTNIALAELGWEHIDQLRSYRLNERHYGVWQGKNKDEVKREYGEEMFLAVRRGYATRPPLLDPNDPRVPWREKKYSLLPRDTLPLGESLKDTKERVVPYFESAIAPYLQKSKNVFVSAHGNSLRALVMYLEKLSPQEIQNFEIPTGEIRVYVFDENLQLNEKIQLDNKTL